MKRYMWNLHTVKANGDTFGSSSSGVEGLFQQALRMNAKAIVLTRGKEIKGKLPTLSDMKGIFKR